MIFNALQLRNYGLFRNTRLDLRPTRGSDGALRNIVLIGGKNGSGKTTILEAVRLCLYGRRSRGLRVRRKDYERFLRAKIHRANDGTPSPTVASVALDFDHIHAGRKRSFKVERKWHDTGRSVTEHLTLACDGQDDLEFNQRHWEEFLAELVPPGLSQLFFFDGEKIQALADDESGDFELVDSMKALLGLDVTDRLQADLAVYLKRQSEETDDESEGGRVVHFQERLAATNQEVRKLHQDRAQIEARLGSVEKKIRQTEGRIAAEGGGFARLRKELLRRRSTVEVTRDRVEEQIRGLASDLLPFSLIPDRCRALGQSLRAESAQHESRAAARYLEGRLSEVSETVAGVIAPNDEGLAQQVKFVLRSHLLPQDEATKANHPIGAELVGRLLNGIEVATEEVPLKVETLASELAEASQELALVQRALEQAPREDVLRPLLSDLADLHTERTEMRAEAHELEEAIRTGCAEETRLQRKLENERLRLAEAEATEVRTRLTVNVQRAVADFAVNLTWLKIDELRRHFHRCFDTLCRKEDLIRDVAVDPKTFKVTFSDSVGRTLGKAELSAGEKQIYAIAMLWALALASRRPLPFLIDTPLGRLDSDHRANLVRKYFPFVSHQVVILSTDTEIDKVYLQDLAPYLSKAYHLRFNEESGDTQVADGYFWLSEDHGKSKVESPPN